MKKIIERFECPKEVAKQLESLIKEIKYICVENKLPFFIGITSKETGNETEYFTEILSPTVAEISLSEDKITKMINVVNGFDVVCRKKLDEIDVNFLN